MINLNKYSIKHLTLIIISGQLLAFIAIQAKIFNYSDLYLNYPLILSGELWRVLTFIFIPPASNIAWAIIGWYIFFLMGSNLENFWGTAHYNLYILIAIVLTNIVSALFNLTIGTNRYLQSSIFLAFAFLNPNFQIRIFFILPLKIKWIALLTWMLYIYSFILGGIGEKLLIAASLLNFVMFFGKDIYYKIKYRGKKTVKVVEEKVSKTIPKHTCILCERNDINHPYLDFRYCSKCTPEQCYCVDHIKDHKHYGE